MTSRSSESGSILMYILIAVALMAALSYAVSETTRGNTQQISSEKARLHGTEIITYADTISKAVAQLRLRGCGISLLNFDNDIVGGYDNTDAPSDGSCNIFALNGGGLKWQAILEEWRDTTNATKPWYGQPLFPSDTCVSGVGTTQNSAGLCDDAGYADLVVVLPWIKREICIEINTLVGMDNPGGLPPKDTALAWANQRFTGTMGNGLEIGNGPNLATFFSRTSGCFEGDSLQAGGYHFYKVLIAR